MKFQLAKCYPDTITESNEIREDLNQELEFQNQAWQLRGEVAARVEKRTLGARRSDGEVFRCYIESLDSMRNNNEDLTDEQVEHVTEQAVQDKQFALVVGKRMFVKDVLKDIGPAQRQRAPHCPRHHLHSTQHCVPNLLPG